MARPNFEPPLSHQRLLLPEMEVAPFQNVTCPAEPEPVIVPPPLPTQVLFIAKHPAERLKPLLAVEVAPEVISKSPPEIVNPDEVAKNPGATSPVYKVEVGAWKLAMDCTERMEPGVVVPIPILPPASIVSLSATPASAIKKLLVGSLPRPHILEPLS